jgi:hypothetical protein
VTDQNRKFFSIEAHSAWIAALIMALIGQGVTLIVKVGSLTERVEGLNRQLEVQQHAFEREIDSLREHR